MQDTQHKDYTWFNALSIALVFGVLPIFHISQLLDIGLVSRFLLLSLCLMVFFTFSKVRIKLHWIELVWASYYIWSLVTIIWAQNFADAIFQAQKLFLVFSLFMFIKAVIGAENTIYKTVCLANIVLLSIGIKQMILLPSFRIYDIYDIIGLQCHKNLYASLIFLFSPFLILGYLNTQNSLWNKCFLSTLFLNIVLMLFLQTRAVYVGLGVFILLGGFLSVWYLRRSITLKGTLKICVFLCVALGTVGLLYKCKSQEVAVRHQQGVSPRVQSVQERLGIWKISKDLIQENSIAGIGIGSWPIVYPKYSLESLSRAQTENVNFQNPHNDFLWVWSELGTIGLLLVMGVYVGVVAVGVKALASKTLSVHASVELTVLIATFVGFQAISSFDFPKDRTEHLMMSTALMVFIIHKSGDTLKLFEIPTWSKVVIVALLALNLKISWSRIEGEKHTVTMYVARAQGDWHMLIDACDRAKSTFYTLDPTGIPLDWYRGVAHFSLGNTGAALQDFEAAYKLNCYNFHILNNLASAHETLGQHDLAKKYYHEAIRINPAFDEAKLNLFVIFYNEGDYTQASHILKSCTQTSDRRTQYFQLLHHKSLKQ